MEFRRLSIYSIYLGRLSAEWYATSLASITTIACVLRKLFYHNIGHPRIAPADSVKADVAERYGDDYLYLGCIHFIYSVCC